MKLFLRHLPRLQRDDGQELALGDKDAALLALAVLEAPVARNRVAALLWPGAPGQAPQASERRALNNLRQRIFRLGRWSGHELLSSGATLTLAPGVEHDLVLAPERLLAEAGGSVGELLGSHRDGDGAELALWLAAARQRWRAARADALLGLAAQLEREDRLGEALRIAARLVTEEPLMEHASRILMRLHHRRGDRGAALAEFERCRRVLYEQHGDAPSDETIALSLEIARADARVARPAALLPLALRHPPRTVGREDAFAHAEQRWQERGIVLLTGPAGIGKSRLLADLARRWRIDLRLRCLPESSSTDFGLLRLLAAACAPLVRSRADAGLQRWLDWLIDPFGEAAPVHKVQSARIAEVCAELLAHARESGFAALSIEDLHYADAASLGVLTALLQASRAEDGDHATRWLLSCRDAELPPLLQQWLDGQPVAGYPMVVLAPLDERASASFLADLMPELMRAHPAAAPQLHRHCGGHPLFMLQVLRQLQLGGALDQGVLPARLPLPDEAMVHATQRLARADAQAQQLAFLAALCGPDFSAELMCRLLRCSAAQLLAPWRRLEELHVFGAQGFAHDLIREAVLAAVPKALAPLLQGDIAHALEEAGADPLRCALHWEAGGQAARAAAGFAQAAQSAEACGLEARAIEWLQRASANHRLAGQAGEAFLCDWRRGHLLLAYASASAAAELARELTTQAQQAREHALAAELRARVKHELQDETAAAEAATALALAQELGDDLLVARGRLRLAEAHALTQRYALALAELDAARPAIPSTEQELHFDWLNARSSVLAALGRREEAVDVQRRALDEAVAERRHAQASFAAGFCATHLAYLCRVEEAVRAAEHCLDLARQAGVERGLVLVDQMGLAGNLGDLGRFAEALAMSERLIADLHEAGLATWAFNAANDRAVMLLRLGRPDLAQQLVAAPAEPAPPWVRGARLMVQARVRQWQGQSAGGLLQRALAVFTEAGLHMHDYVRHKITVEVARADSPEAALQAADAALHWARAHQHEAMARQVQMVGVEALLRLQRVPEAAARARALSAAPGLGQEAFGFYLPELLLVLHDALRADGDDALASRHAQCARAWIDTCAVQTVPELFVESFRERNPINRRLIGSGMAAPVTGR